MNHNCYNDIKVILIAKYGVLSLLMANYLNKQKYIKLLHHTRNIKEANESIGIEKPNIVILDLNFTKEEVESLLKQNIDESEKVIICLSKKGQECFLNNSYSIYNLFKPISLEILYKTILEIASFKGFKNDIDFLTLYKNLGICEKITRIFKSLGIPPHLDGFSFLTEAVKVIIYEPNILNNVTSLLYPIIADQFQTEPTRVERSIRNAINTMWISGKAENIKALFGINIFDNREKPTNSEFISMIADILTINAKHNA